MNTKPQNVKTAWAKGLLNWLRHARVVHRQRQALRRLSPDQLVDIGVSPEAARNEVRRAFWDLPRSSPRFSSSDETRTKRRRGNAPGGDRRILLHRRTVRSIKGA